MTAVHYAILTHNRRRRLARLIRSVAGQSTRTQDRITIFDNGSDPENAQAVSEIAAAHGAVVLRSSTNLYMAGRRALEDGIVDAGVDADVLVHLDDDVVLHDGWLQAVLIGLMGNGIVACGSVEDRAGDLMISGQQTIDLYRHPGPVGDVDVWRWAWHEPGASLPRIPVDFAGHRALAALSGIAATVRHDPALIAGGDDIDYSLALRGHGGALAVASDAIIVHRSLGELDAHPRARDAVIASWLRFYAKWGFARDSAADEAGMTLDAFLAAVTIDTSTKATQTRQGALR